jgi:hypothetical protein
MRCPECDATILDDEAAFCPRCGKPLGIREAEATTELKVPPEVNSSDNPDSAGDTGDTAVVERPDDRHTDVAEPAPATPTFLHDFLSSLRGALRRGAWGPLSAVAAFGFLALLAAGALLVLGVKMQYPDIGSGSDPLASLFALVIVGLGVMRVPIHIGELSVSALPLGALAAVGYLIVWATARALRRRAGQPLGVMVVEGAKLAVPFALICFLAALIFRIRTDPTPVAADAFGALVLGALWGAFFGALGGLVAGGSLREHARRALEAVRARWEFGYHGVRAGAAMLGVSFLLGAIASLFWVIAGLLGGGPDEFGLGEAGAAAIYLVAFAPNVVVSIVAIGLGAPVEIGAQVSSAGRLIGPLQEISLFGWGAGDPPWFAYLLILIPALACLLGGFAAHRSARAGDGATSKLMFPTLAVAAATYALVLFEIAALSEARLGAGLVRNRGFGRVAPDAGMVLVLAAFWAVAAGLVGWELVGSDPGDPGSPEDPEPAARDEPEG